MSIDSRCLPCSSSAYDVGLAGHHVRGPLVVSGADVFARAQRAPETFTVRGSVYETPWGPMVYEAGLSGSHSRRLLRFAIAQSNEIKNLAQAAQNTSDPQKAQDLLSKIVVSAAKDPWNVAPTQDQINQKLADPKQAQAILDRIQQAMKPASSPAPAAPPPAPAPAPAPPPAPAPAPAPPASYTDSAPSSPGYSDTSTSSSTSSPSPPPFSLAPSPAPASGAGTVFWHIDTASGRLVPVDQSGNLVATDPSGNPILDPAGNPVLATPPAPAGSTSPAAPPSDGTSDQTSGGGVAAPPSSGSSSGTLIVVLAILGALLSGGRK